jgi:hypothetical protein
MAGARARARGEAARAVIFNSLASRASRGFSYASRPSNLPAGCAWTPAATRARSRGEAEFARAEFARVPTA